MAAQNAALRSAMASAAAASRFAALLSDAACSTQMLSARPGLLLTNLISKPNPSRDCKLGVISARVGSISDNRLGGWYSHQASKAALNMLIKNFAIELARKGRHHTIRLTQRPG